MDDDQKRDIIASRRGTLENELFGAELDLKLAEQGDSEALMEEPKKRVEELKAKMAVLDEEEAALEGA